MHRLLLTATLSTALLVGAAACSDDDGGEGAAAGAASTTVAGAPAGSTTLGPTTTFMPTCGTMPAPTDIAAAVGVPLGDGEVVESGTCQFLGLNDQSLVVFVAALTDPADQAAFADLQNSLGPAVAVADPVGAMLGPDGQVFINKDGTIYKVMTMVTGGTAYEQANLSAAVLKMWLGI